MVALQVGGDCQGKKQSLRKENWWMRTVVQCFGVEDVGHFGDAKYYAESCNMAPA